MSIFTIYKVTNTVNQKIYIGYTSLSVHERLNLHFTDAKRNKRSISHFHRAIVAYGEENFTIEEIYQSHDAEHTLEFMEPYFINEYKAQGFELFNIQSGGKGYKNNPNKKAVDVYDLDFNFIKTCQSMSDAARFIGTKVSCIVERCRNAEQGKGSKLKNYYVCYTGQNPVKKDFTYMTKRNQEIKPNLGKTRPEHSKAMKGHPALVDQTVYIFKHKTGLEYTGTRQGLIETYPDHKLSSSELGVLIRGNYKSHRGWTIGK